MKTITQKRQLAIFVLSFAFALLFCMQIKSVSAETENGKVTQVTVKGKYYWKQEDGKLRTKGGWYEVGKNRYYLEKGGACVVGFKKIGGKLFYFTSKGALAQKTGWLKGPNYTYYYYKDHSLAYGYKKIGSKNYFFTTDKGRLVKNKRAVRSLGVYYVTDAKGVATKISNVRGDCMRAAQRFINLHSSSSQSKEARFRSCFNYLNAYMRYSPGYFSMNADYAKIREVDWQYKLALELFNSSVLRGNCHRFACCVGAIAAELGYKPTIIATTGDHSFVMINGRYYDNMGSKFGSSTHSSYSVYRKAVM